MAKLLKLRRGTTSQHSSFTGAEGEVTVDTTKDTLVVHDGSTAGGTPLAKESAVNAIPAVIDEDNMSTNSATRPPSQQSVKAYVDALPDVIDEDNMSSDSATRPPSQQSTKAYVDTTVAAHLLDEDNFASDSATKPPSQQSVKAYIQTVSDADAATYATINNSNLTGTATGVNLTLSGNLQVNGTTTTVASTTMTVADKNIEIAKGAANDAAADGGGITLDSGDGDKEIKWVNATDYWTFNQGIETTAGEISIKGAEGNSAILKLTADEGDDNADYWRLVSGSGGNFTLDSKSTGSWVTGLTLEGGGGATLSAGLTTNGSVSIAGGELNFNTAGHKYIDFATEGGGQNYDATFRLMDSSHTNHETALALTRNGGVKAYFDNAIKFQTTTAGVTVTGSVTDSKGDVRKIIQNSQSSAYTLVAADAGKHVIISSGGVTVPDNVFAAGDAVTIINNSGSDQTITQGSGVTMYNTADASTGNRTLAARGMSTLLYTAVDAVYISGSGLS